MVAGVATLRDNSAGNDAGHAKYMEATTDFVPARAGAILDVSMLAQDATKRRLRDRYVATRFAQFPEPGVALRHTSEMVRWARQLLDDDQPRLAVELLQLALEEDPNQRPLWLFLIELAFLNSDTPSFNALADEFKQRFNMIGKADEAVKTIDAMGIELDHSDPRYANAGEPEMLPNWSNPEFAARNEERQRKFHASLVEAMSFHTTAAKG
jgi:hypothetical protein